MEIDIDENFSDSSLDDEVEEVKKTPKTRVSRKMSIKDDIVAMGLPWNVQEKADQIFYTIGRPSPRGKEKQRMLYFCIQQAILSCGTDNDPRLIFQQLGLSKGDATKAIRRYKGLYPEYQPLYTSNSPLDHIDEYCEKLNLTSVSKQEINNMMQELISKKPSLLDNSSSTLLAGAILYFCNIRGIDISIDTMANSLKYSAATIKTKHKIISTLHNEDKE